MIYVLDKENNPLMPTNRYGKVRHLLKDKKAAIVKRSPFTIKLLYDSVTFKQDITLGVDAGSKIIGLSATTKNKELFASEIILRNDIVDLLATRSQNRRAKRRRLRYRKPRFLNRVKSRKKGWLAPSIKHKIDTHLTVVSNVCKLLPITKIIVETAAFDIQKIKNDKISGCEYQQGEQMGFWNVREYVLFRDGHKCHGKTGCKNKVLNVHHIESRKTGGDSPNNLITLCEDCHKSYHDGTLSKVFKRGQSFKDAAFMGIMRWSFYNKLKETYIPLGVEVSNTYGYVTKNKRIINGLPKEHCIDAYCITDNLGATLSDNVLVQKKVRRHNRQIHRAKILKGNRKQRKQAPYIVKRFRLFDKVSYKGQECFITTRRVAGYFSVRTVNYVSLSTQVNVKDLRLLETRKGFISQTLKREGGRDKCTIPGLSG